VVVTNDSELVFSFEGKTATAVAATDLASLGLTEREHLQTWVIEHPEILGANILVVSFEFDKWMAPNGATPKDRLDVLGLDTDGRLVVAELKRGLAPDTVELQAIKYAAMASRMSEDALVNLFVEFRLSTHGEALTPDGALEILLAHAQDGISVDSLSKPRIVLLAEDFREVTTSSIVWLCEQGLDITMKRYQAYRTHSGENILTVSQYYPIADISEFQIAPKKANSKMKAVDDLPEVEWSRDDLQLIIDKGFVVPLAILDLCSQRPEEIIPSSEAYRLAGVEQQSGMGRLAGFGYSVRRTFGRSNFPWRTQWAAGGISQQYYSIDEVTAKNWLELRELDALRTKH
jgi:hypothetical protein